MAVRKRGRIWYYDFQIRKERYRGAIPEARTKQEAEQAETKIRAELFEGHYGRTRLSPYLPEFIGDTYLTWARENKRSWYDDDLICKCICDFFGKVRLGDVSPLHVEKFKKHRRELPTKYSTPLNPRPRQPATVNRELSILSKVFTLAVDAGVLQSNPCRKVKWLRHDNARQRVLTDEEEKKLLERLEGKEPLRSIVTLALHTGMRRGEILALRWREIDFSRGLIHVTQTKTARNRLVPLNDDAREAIQKQKRQSEVIFISPRTGKQLVEIKKGFTKACLDAGVQDFHFHDLRHTFASRLAEAGEDAFTIMELLGHSSFQMTKRYTHASDERKRKAVENLSAPKTRVSNVSQIKKRQAL